MRALLPTALVSACAAVPLAAQPLQNHLLMATSPDGLAWERLNQVFADHGDVPDAVVGPTGQVHVYFQGLWTPTQDGIMVGVSPDGLGNWTFHQVPIAGTQGWLGRPADPDVIVTGTTFRLYFTGDPTGDMQPETYSAVSTDGINFTREAGVRFAVSGGMVLDPSLLWTGTVFQYFAGGAAPGQNWHAHSSDGLTFLQQSNFNADGFMLANGLALPGTGYRFYGFPNSPQSGIRSLYSNNGEDWTVEPDWRLQLDTSSGLESRYVKDPAVVYKDGIYYMYYVTRIPVTPGDMNRDGSVDLADFPQFEICFTGPGGALAPGCEPGDFDGDNDIDCDDWVQFGLVWTGPGQLPELSQCSVASIPTVSQWGLVTLTLLLMTAATVVIRRTRYAILPTTTATPIWTSLTSPSSSRTARGRGSGICTPSADAIMGRKGAC